jgi:hypothetical protein
VYVRVCVCVSERESVCERENVCVCVRERVCYPSLSQCLLLPSWSVLFFPFQVFGIPSSFHCAFSSSVRGRVCVGVCI